MLYAVHKKNYNINMKSKEYFQRSVNKGWISKYAGTKNFSTRENRRKVCPHSHITECQITYNQPNTVVSNGACLQMVQVFLPYFSEYFSNSYTVLSCHFFSTLNAKHRSKPF